MKRSALAFLFAFSFVCFAPMLSAEYDSGGGTETETGDEPNPPVEPSVPEPGDCDGDESETESISYRLSLGSTIYTTQNNFVAQDWQKRIPPFKNYNPPTTDDAPLSSSLASEWGRRLSRPVVVGLLTDEITDTSFTPAGLQLYGDNAGSAWVKKDGSGALRQILSDQFLTDITFADGATTLSIYYRETIGGMSGGLYTIPGTAKLHRQVVISRPTPTGLDTLDILTTDYSSSQTSPKVKGDRWVTTGTAPNETWTLSHHNGAPASTPAYRSNELVRQDLGDGLLQRTRTIREAGSSGTLIVTSTTREKYRDLGNGTLRIVERVEAPGTPEELTTTFTYTDATGTGSVGVNGVIDAPAPDAPINQLVGARLRTLQRSDGYWEEYAYQYNSGTKIMLTEKWSSWKNAAVGDKANARHTSIILEEGSRTVIEKIGGQIVSNEYETLTVAGDGTRTLRTEKKTGTNTAPLITEHAYFPDNAAEPFKGRIQYTRHPDGTLTRYTYSHVPDVTNPALTAVKTVTEKGAVDAAQFAPAATGPIPTLTQGTRTETLTNTFERVIQEQVTDIESGLVLSQWQAVTVDDVGRPTHIIHDGDPDDYQTLAYACCGIQTHRQRDGSVTEHTRDAAGRPTITTVTLGSKVTTTYHTYGSETLGGRELPKTTISRAITAGSESTGTLLVSEDIVNLRRQTLLTRSPDVDGDGNPEVTTHAYEVATRTRSTTGPDGVTRTSTTYADGQPHTSVSTHDSEPITPLTTYDYAPHNLNGGGIKTTVNQSGTGVSPAASISYENLAGRIFRTETPGHNDSILVTETTFDERARSTGTTSTGKPATLRVLNLLGETTESWIDANGDNAFDNTAIDGVKDRVTLSATDYVTEEGRVCQRTRRWIRNDNDTDILVSSTFHSTDGLYQKSIPLAGSTTTRTTTKPLNGNVSATQTSSLPAGVLTATSSATLGADGQTTLVTETKDADTTSITTQTETRDLQGRTISIHDGRTPATTFSDFTAAGRPRTTTHGDGTSTSVTLDPAGRVIKTETRDDQNTLIATVNTTYHPTGRVAANWGTNTNPTYKLYDLQGNLVELRTYRSSDLTLAPTASTPDYDATTWEYESATGLLLAKRYADNKGPDYTYTADGKLATRQWWRSPVASPNERLTTTYSYNHAGELTTTTYNDATPPVSLTYNRLGRKVTETNGIATTEYAYDPTTLAPDTETISYDLNGDTTPDFTRVLDRSRDLINRDTGWQLKDGTTIENEVEYRYDTTGRIGEIESPAGVFSYLYAPSSSLIASVTGPAHTVTNTWDPTRNVLTLKQNKVGTTVISSYDYTVNALGQRTNVEQTGTAFSSSRDIAWAYDALGQVTSADSSIPAHNRAYQYDAIGNRLFSEISNTQISDPATANTTAYTANALNQYTAIDSLTPAYDDDGNMTSGPLPAAPESNSTLTWDAENRLISATVNSVTTTYLYDAQSRRIATTTGSDTILYLYDAWNPIAEYSYSALATPNSALTKSYTWGSDLSGSMQGAGGVGGLLAVTEHGSSIDHYFPAFDGNGNVSEYLDETGAVAAHFEYDPFGRAVVSTGTKAADFTYCFSTKPIDAATGLYYYGYRYYDPVTGRWPSRDPIEEKGGLNIYAFSSNKSIFSIDVLGASGVELTNMSGFMHWLFGGGTPLKVSWNSFDPTQAARDSLKLQWKLANMQRIIDECEDMDWNSTKSIKMSSPDLDVVFFSPIGWISGWHGKISGYITNGGDNVDLWKTKKDSKCECLAIADVRMRAEDRSDFNPGDTFIDGLGLEWRDDWFIWVRDNTPVGYDYDIYNWQDDYVEWKIEYN